MFITGRDWTVAVWIQFVLEIILFVYGYYRYIYKKETNKNKLIFKTLFYLYLIGVLFVTILPLDFQFFKLDNYTYFSANNFIHPFEDLLKGRSGALRGIILNIIMLIPFGFLYPLTTKKSSIINCFMQGLFFILGIEILQMLLSLFCIGFRTFDITDVIVNTTGVLIGWVIYKVLALMSTALKRI